MTVVCGEWAAWLLPLRGCWAERVQPQQGPGGTFPPTWRRGFGWLGSAGGEGQGQKEAEQLPALRGQRGTWWGVQVALRR